MNGCFHRVAAVAAAVANTAAAGPGRLFSSRAGRSALPLPPQIGAVVKGAAAVVGETVQVQGWVRTVRRQKRVAFVTLYDGGSADQLQVVFLDPQLCPPDFQLGAAVKISGVVRADPRDPSLCELHVEPGSPVELVGACDPNSYPLAGKHHGLEYLREHPHLRVRTATIAAMLRVRSALSRSMHRFFDEQGFCQVHTPVITGNDCEGGGETFAVSTKEHGVQPITDGAAVQLEFFGTPAFLTVSGQLHAEALSAGLNRVYVLGPTFRAENSHSPRHLAEFYMLEAEMSFAGLPEAVAVTEGLFQACMSDLRNTCDPDLQVLARQNPGAALSDDWEKPCSVITYTDAIEALGNARTAGFRYPVVWGMDLKFEHEQWLAKEYCDGPVFVTDYPSSLKPFYMRENDDGKTVGCFDFLVPGIGELAGGSAREERLGRLEGRMAAKGMADAGGMEWYSDLRRFGTVPHAGFGMGFERLLQYATGTANIRDAIPFVRHAGSCRL